jgi:hypothetical protein
MTNLPEELQAEIAALADGTLDARRSEQLMLQLASSPQLAAALEQQRSALAAIEVAQGTLAPAALRSGLEAKLAGAGRDARRADAPPAAKPRRPRGSFRARFAPSGPRLASAAAIGLASLGIVLGFTLTETGVPTLAKAVALTQRTPTGTARPHPLGRARVARTLDVSIEGIAFPAWRRRFGWRATGTRTVRIGGRRATAVYYAYRARPVTRTAGYAIVSGAPLAARGGEVVKRGRVRYRLLFVDGVPTVTWLRDGHTCVIAGPHLASSTLLALASSRAS